MNLLLCIEYNCVLIFANLYFSKLVRQGRKPKISLTLAQQLLLHPTNHHLCRLRNRRLWRTNTKKLNTAPALTRPRSLLNSVKKKTSTLLNFVEFIAKKRDFSIIVSSDINLFRWQQNGSETR